MTTLAGIAWQPGWSLMDGGVRVKETSTHYVDVMKTTFNWRICYTPKSCPQTYDRGYCYEGHDPSLALLAAEMWQPDREREPMGWIKALDGTFRRRPDGDPEQEYVAP